MYFFVLSLVLAKDALICVLFPVVLVERTVVVVVVVVGVVVCNLLFAAKVVDEMDDDDTAGKIMDDFPNSDAVVDDCIALGYSP
jgi:hypothetical protein